MENTIHKKRILIVEDELPIADLLSYALMKEGYITKISSTGSSALFTLSQFNPDIILLDLMLPDMNGMDICKTISQSYSIPVILITAKSDIVDKVLGLEMGADDYITKPFDVREVIARVKSCLRKSEQINKTQNLNKITLRSGIIIYKDEYKVTKNSVVLELTPKEYQVLLLLAENKGIVFSREKFLDLVWGYEYAGDTRTVDIHIQRLRKKINDNESMSIIETVFSVGYKINND